MGDLKYCFEQEYVPSVLRNIKPQGLAVVDTDGIHAETLRSTLARGVFVYGYLNVGALEKERPYAEPIHYTLTPQQILTFKGINNVYSNTNGQT